MGPGDAYCGWVDAAGAGWLSDRVTTKRQLLGHEASQDGTLVSHSKANGLTTIAFSRALDTGDADDRVLTAGGRANVIWATSDALPAAVDADLAYHSARGHTQLDFASGATGNGRGGFDGQFYVPLLVLLAFVLLLALLGLAVHVLPGPAAARRLHGVLGRRPLPPLKPSLGHRLLLDFLPALFGLSVAEALVCVLWGAALLCLLAFRAYEVTGRLTAFALGTVLLPVTRNSVWNKLLGCPFERAIKFHRWVARVLLVLTTVHGLLMLVRQGRVVLTRSRPLLWCRRARFCPGAAPECPTEPQFFF